MRTARGRPAPRSMSCTSRFRRLVALWNNCVDDLRKVATKKRGARALDAAGWAALPPELRAEYDHPIATLRVALGPAAFARTWAEGRATSLDAVIDTALSELPEL